MKKAIAEYNISIFFLITMILSLLLFPLHYVFQSVGNYSVSFAQFAPAIAVIVLAIIAKDNILIPKIKRSFYIHVDNLKWMGISFLIPLICISISSMALVRMNIDFSPWVGSGLFYFLNIIALFIGCFAEEIGWRGYLLPALQKRHSPIMSSIIVGILWGLWHLNFMGGLLGFFLYIITIVETSILMTWQYNKTNGNLVTMVIYHFTFSLSSHVLLWDRFTLQLFIVESIVFGIACMVVILTNREVFLLKPSPANMALSKN